MKIDMLNPITRATLFLEFLDQNNQTLCSGTGFLVIHKDTTYLITNWHLATGGNPRERTYKHYPTSVRVYFFEQNMEDLESIIIPVRDDGKELWKEKVLDSTNGYYDIIALPLTNKQVESIITKGWVPFNCSEERATPDIEPGDLLFVVGYPLGYKINDRYPIWKSAYLSSDHIIDFEKEPVFAIDTRTSHGMSGGPVVFKVGGTSRLGEGVTRIGNPSYYLMGIYSGRWLINDKVAKRKRDIGIGRVWKESAIIEVLNS